MPGGKFLQKVFEPMMKRGIASYRRSGGKNRMSTMMAFRVVRLTMKGARSGQARTATLGGFADGDDAWLIVASKGGAADNPAWFNNMVKHPDDIWLEVGTRKMKVRGDCLTGHQREEALARVAAVSPRYPAYHQQTDPDTPLLPLIPTSACN